MSNQDYRGGRTRLRAQEKPPAGPVLENPANNDPAQRQVGEAHTEEPAHTGAQAASAAVRLGQLRALHAAAIRQGNADEAARLAVEIEALS